jgi:hypothetical protein
MPTVTDSQPVSIRLDNGLIEALKHVAYCRSVAQGHKVAYTDLIREAIHAVYPIAAKLVGMSDIERICWMHVYTGVEKMRISGANVCVIKQGGSTHPIGNWHTIALAQHKQAAREYGLYVTAVAVIVRRDESEHTEDFLLLSKAPLSPEEVTSFIPDFRIGIDRLDESVA